MTETKTVEVPLYDQLAALIAKATDEDLADGGRYFAETCHDLTRCRHEETGEYQHATDGELIELLWNNRRTILDSLASQSLSTDEEVRRLVEAASALDRVTDWDEYAELPGDTRITLTASTGEEIGDSFTLGDVRKLRQALQSKDTPSHD